MSWLTTGQIFRCIDPWPRMGPRSLIDCSSVKLSRRVGRCCYVRARRSYPVWPCDGGKYGYGFPVSHAVCPSVSPIPQMTAYSLQNLDIFNLFRFPSNTRNNTSSNKKIEVANQSIKHFSVNNLNRSIGPASCRKANYFGGDQLVLGAAINLEFGDLGRLDFDLVMGVHDGLSFAASSKIPSIETRRHGRAHGEGDREAAAARLASVTWAWTTRVVPSTDCCVRPLQEEKKLFRSCIAFSLI